MHGWNPQPNSFAAEFVFTTLASVDVPRFTQGRLTHTKVELQSSPSGQSYYYCALCPDHEKPNTLLEIATTRPLSNLALTTNTNSIESYMAWQDGLFVCFVKLPEPIIPRTLNGFDAWPPSAFFADHIINLEDFEKWEKAATNNPDSDVTLTSVVTKPDGLTVTATNRAGDRLIFHKSKTGWVAFNGTNEIRRAKPSKPVWSSLAEQGHWKYEMPLFTNRLTFKTSTGSPKVVDVSLQPKMFRQGDHGIYQNYWTYQLYETTNTENKYSRPVWELFVPTKNWGNFTIVGKGGGDGYYLCWTDISGRLCLSAITNRWPDAKYEEDPNEGPFSHSLDDRMMRGGVDHIIDLRQFAGGERFFKGGGGVASAKQEGNVLTLTVTNVTGSKFTFSNPDGQWHAYSFWGEINRVKK